MTCPDHFFVYSSQAARNDAATYHCVIQCSPAWYKMWDVSPA